MTDLNKLTRAAMVKFNGDRFELVYSYQGKCWYAKLYRHAVDNEAAVAELARRGIHDSTTLREMEEARRDIQERPVAVGDGLTAEEAVASIKGVSR